MNHSTLVGLIATLVLLAALLPGVRTQIRSLYNPKHPLIYVGLPMLVLCLSNGRILSSTDNASVQLTSASLIEYGTLDFSRFFGYASRDQIDCSVKRDFYTVCSKQGMYAGTPPGMLLIAVPSFIIAKMVGANLQDTTALWRLGKWTAAWLASAILVLFHLIALHAGPPRAALIATALLGAGSSLWAIIGQGLWSHGGVCLWICIALWLTTRLKQRPLQIGIAIGLCWGAMFASRVTSAPLILVFSIWILLCSPRAFLGAAAGGIAGFCFLMLFNQVVYANPLGAQFVGAAESTRVVFSTRYFIAGFSGLLISPGAGLLIYQPWVLLLFAWFLKKPIQLSSGLPAGWPAACLLMVLAQLLLFSFFVDWHGQYAWGTRYLAETMPLLALALVPLLPLPGQVVLGLVAFLIQLNGTRPGGGAWPADPRPQDTEKTMSERVHDWSDPAFLYPLTR